MLLGVVADTHGYFNPRLREILRGVDGILHAGDIDSKAVIQALERIAPVAAVRGNVDRGRLAADYPAWREMEIEGHRLLLLHRGGRVLASDATLAAIVARVQPHILVYGHTHQAFVGWEGGIYHFNPGLSGRSRQGVQPSAGILRVEATALEGKILKL